ncbi:hypothetical protein J3F84DRAFT_209756 [Trichoderma pleuroticola]
MGCHQNSRCLRLHWPLRKRSCDGRDEVGIEAVVFAMAGCAGHFSAAVVVVVVDAGATASCVGADADAVLVDAALSSIFLICGVPGGFSSKGPRRQYTSCHLSASSTAHACLKMSWLCRGAFDGFSRTVRRRWRACLFST